MTVSCPAQPETKERVMHDLLDILFASFQSLSNLVNPLSPGHRPSQGVQALHQKADESCLPQVS